MINVEGILLKEKMSPVLYIYGDILVIHFQVFAAMSDT